MMAIAALLATSSSVNANLFGAGNVTKSLADTRQFPTFFGEPSRIAGTRGFMLTLVTVLVLANVFNLSAIANMGSAIALAIFLLLSVAGYRLRSETGSNTVLIVLAAAATAIVLLVFLVDLARNEPATLAWLGAFTVLAIFFDFAWKARRGHTQG
jgi:L-asparagine transporter-like permease